MKKTHVMFLLDETGSMNSIKAETISGFNEYLGSLKKATEPIRFTCIKFDSDGYRLHAENEPVMEVKPLTEKNYKPGAMTPLVDACWHAIKRMDGMVAGKKKPRVTITIQTDGYENASVEHSTLELAGLISKKKRAGWVFNFIGADMDAFHVAKRLNIEPEHTHRYTAGETVAVMDSLAHNTVAYAATGSAKSMAFTDEQRIKMKKKKGATSDATA